MWPKWSMEQKRYRNSEQSKKEHRAAHCVFCEQKSVRLAAILSILNYTDLFETETERMRKKKYGCKCNKHQLKQQQHWKKKATTKIQTKIRSTQYLANVCTCTCIPTI